MAEQIAIPAGVNPGAAIPNDASQVGGGGLPPVPPAANQVPGFVPPAPAPAAPAAPAGIDAAQYAEFQAWQAAQKAAAAAPAPAATPTPPTPAPAAAPSGEGMGAQGAMDAVRAAGVNDPVVTNTFEMFSLVAPDVDLVRALGTAIDRADLSLIDRAYLRETTGDKAEKLIKLAEGMVGHVNATVERMIGDVYTAAGGKDQWAAASAAFSQSAPDYLKGYVAESLNSANPARVQQATKAVLDFVRQSGAVPQAPQGHVRAGGGAPDGAMGLSKAQYQAERLKLNRLDRNYADQARELDARRALGKQMGL